jgi:hypothetical protein
MSSLYVAAGGGGDALAAAIVHRALGHRAPALIATYAWDRLAIDPLPGPRGLADFTGLQRLGPAVYAIRWSTRPRPPSGSSLPRLAGHLADTLVLLDPADGAVGLSEQLAEMVTLAETETVAVLDVGGDAVARGDEDELRSPVADALALAAVDRLALPATVLVAGPGLDGELREREVLAVTGREPLLVLRPPDVAPFRTVLTWHPSEATALLVAAARGLRGRVEIRDAGLGVRLTAASAGVYALPLAEVMEINRLASAVRTSTSLDEAEKIVRENDARSEIDYERDKADRWAVSAAVPAALPGAELDRLVAEVEATAVRRGVDFLTFRRIAEATGLPPGTVAGLRERLVAARPAHYVWPLWSLAPRGPMSRSGGRRPSSGHDARRTAPRPARPRRPRP